MDVKERKSEGSGASSAGAMVWMRVAHLAGE